MAEQVNPKGAQECACGKPLDFCVAPACPQRKGALSRFWPWVIVPVLAAGIFWLGYFVRTTSRVDQYQAYKGSGWCSFTYVDKTNTIVGVAIRKLIVAQNGPYENVPDEPPNTANASVKCAGTMLLCPGAVSDRDLAYWPGHWHGYYERWCP